MGLKPQNIVQAAQADLERRERNRDRVPDEHGWAIRNDAMEPYAFHRKHVRVADSVRDLIKRAAENPEIAVPKTRDDEPLTTKRNTIIIYSDVPLLKRALALVTEGCDGE